MELISEVMEELEMYQGFDQELGDDDLKNYIYRIDSISSQVHQCLLHMYNLPLVETIVD